MCIWCVLTRDKKDRSNTESSGSRSSSALLQSHITTLIASELVVQPVVCKSLIWLWVKSAGLSEHDRGLQVGNNTVDSSGSVDACLRSTRSRLNCQHHLGNLQHAQSTKLGKQVKKMKNRGSAQGANPSQSAISISTALSQMTAKAARWWTVHRVMFVFLHAFSDAKLQYSNTEARDLLKVTLINISHSLL